MEPIALESTPVEWTPVEKLDADSLNGILCELDGFTLGRVLCVCHHWRIAALRDDLWGAACRKRWNMPMRSSKPPRLGEDVRRTWHEVHRVYHRLRKRPQLPSLSRREVVYATGMQSRVGCWLLVAHQPACWLPAASDDKSASLVLRARVIVQNLRLEPLLLQPDGGLALCYRGLASPVAVPIVRARLHAPPQPPPAPRADAAEGWEGARGRPLCLRPLECALLECELPALTGMRHEPDLLEACDALLLRASTAGGGGVAVLQCPFDVDEIWAHYELIGRDFWVHHEEEEGQEGRALSRPRRTIAPSIFAE